MVMNKFISTEAELLEFVKASLNNVLQTNVDASAVEVDEGVGNLSSSSN